ncbi:MAG: hypothetical protein PHF86_08275 [Candidatus Nanoarchaeia archaeon]|nr:hypothetical protein [Candidatus Nanoarchaeia archaeon]
MNSMKYEIGKCILSTLIFVGSMQAIRTVAITADQIINDRPLYERVYYPETNLSICSGPNEIVDNSSGKKYILNKEEIVNPWDNIPYKIKTDKLFLEEIK